MNRNCSCRCGPFTVSLIPPGILKPLILRILGSGPLHGYEIMQEIALRSGGYWRPAAGSIYPALTSLEEEGYVGRHKLRQGERIKQVYTLTSEGKKAITGMDRFSDELKTSFDHLLKLW